MLIYPPPPAGIIPTKPLGMAAAADRKSKVIFACLLPLSILLAHNVAEAPEQIT